jgi:two-component system, NarL family, nitrate/nitrite response regulator NarL
VGAISIYIIDDHQMLIDGIKAILRDEKTIHVCGENTVPVFAIDEILQLKPDIVLTDINMPEMSGSEVVRKLYPLLPKTRYIALSMFGERGHIRDMLNAGVSGYILKNTGREQLLKAINTVYNGGEYFSEEISNVLDAATADGNPPSNLTAREIDIVECISREMTNAEIARTLFISERTVETHRKNIFRKTGSRSVLGLVKYAMDNGFIKG